MICVDDAGLPAAVSSDDPTIYAAHFCTMREPKETYSRVCARFPHEHTLFGLRVVQKGALKPNTSGACLLLLLLLLPFAAVLQPDADAAAAAAAIKTNPDVPSRRVPTTRCRTLPARHATTAWGTRAAMECRASRFVPSVTWAVCIAQRIIEDSCCGNAVVLRALVWSGNSRRQQIHCSLGSAGCLEKSTLHIATFLNWYCSGAKLGKLDKMSVLLLSILYTCKR